MQFHPKEYLQKVAELCKKNNVHLIVDEVFVGFGRLGSICISEKEGIHPDFICFAKGLTAGYVPLAATMASEEIYQQFLGEFSDLKALFHGHTFTGNPLGCAVALENIRLLEKFIKSQNLENNISFFANEFQRTTQNLNCAKNFRQRGMIAAFDLHPPNKPNQNFPTNLRVGIQVAIEARKHKILIRPLGDSILVVPPINIEKSEISTLFENLILSINETLAVL
jgi:adenosylmethionine-8-amino-7-oxononanoate aminotransferase